MVKGGYMDKLKIELFELRREIDILEARKQQLVQIYNTKIEELIKIENKDKEQNKKNNDSKKQKGAN